eukprot:12902765-Prorocentrum_lima.AAC.1
MCIRDSLMGDHWLQRVKAHADRAGKKRGLNSVCGVGGSSNAVRTKADQCLTTVTFQLYLGYAQLKP